MSDIVYETNIEGLRLAFRGKVRDAYDLGDALLIVTSDRLSAFDVVIGWLAVMGAGWTGADAAAQAGTFTRSRRSQRVGWRPSRACR